MRKLVVGLIMASALSFVACGGGSDNGAGTQGKNVVKLNDFLGEEAAITSAEARMKNDDLEITYSVADKKVDWASSTSSETPPSVSEKIEALQNFVTVTQFFLNKYSNKPLILATNDGKTVSTNLNNESIYVYNQKIKLAQGKISELQATPSPASSASSSTQTPLLSVPQ